MHGVLVEWEVALTRAHALELLQYVVVLRRSHHAWYLIARCQHDLTLSHHSLILGLLVLLTLLFLLLVCLLGRCCWLSLLLGLSQVGLGLCNDLITCGTIRAVSILLLRCGIGVRGSACLRVLVLAECGWLQTRPDTTLVTSRNRLLQLEDWLALLCCWLLRLPQHTAGGRPSACAPH